MKINFHVLNQVLPKYKNHLEIKKLAGLTNTNYRIKADEKFYFYKIYNTSFSDGLLQREYERKILKVIDDHPKVHFMNEEMVIRDFLPNVRPIKINELTTPTIHKINQDLMKIHGLSRGISQRHCLLRFVFDQNYLLQLCAKIRNSKLSEAEKEAFVKIIQEIVKMTPFLLKFLDKYASSNVICHNDLTLENLLFSEQEKTLLLIDFDYSNFNPLFYEFANLFVEMESEFFESEPFFRISRETTDTRALKKLIVQNYLSQTKIEGIAEEDFFLICKSFEPFSHLFWIIICAESLDVEAHLDFLSYAQFRFDLCQENFIHNKFFEKMVG